MNLIRSTSHLPRELEEPIRAELFGVERLEQHAESLATAQIVSADMRRGRPLIPRVIENGQILVESYRTIIRSIQKEHTITPAAEWLVDNFHIVDEQLREIIDDLPPGYYRQLPKLASGHLKDYPRVFGVAWAFVAHTDSRFDPDMLRRFVEAYQRVQPLTIGELWAVAITLRVVLVENLRRLTERIVHSRAARRDADILADSLLGTGPLSSGSHLTTLQRFERAPLATAFAVQLVQRLRDLDPKVRPILQWLDDRLAAQGTTADDMVHAEHQQQAAMNVTVRNVITSMRLTSAFDWAEFFESVSLVDTILHRAPSYAEMDFATRDAYRHAIEDLSRGSDLSEIDVAMRVVKRAQEAGIERDDGPEPHQERHAEPGYYLISRGRPAFESELGYKVSWKSGLLRLYVRAAVPGYLGSLAVVTALAVALPLWAGDAGATAAGLALLGLLAVVPASDIAVALVNRSVMALLGPRKLPRMELRHGVPKEFRTIVVVPTLLTNRADIEEQVERLEVHYLANPEDDLRFALLSDWKDAETEILSGDADLLAAARDHIGRLNTRYGAASGGGARFLLFHRRRAWNEAQGIWMGWERKRGKLHELNRFLRGATDTTFLSIDGHPPETIPAVRYVITLDADTRLPRGAARRLVGTMAHPLNRPRFDSRARRIVEGYGLVQPRITPSLPTDRDGTYFQRTFSGPSGIDPYASAVSDVYQDLFQEGSYTGKGIYDVDAFEAALADKVPDNAMLSHDLFEGIFARVALATDIELFEAFPSHYEAAAARQHRWARGDWQLLPWVLGRRGSKARRSAEIPTVGRWKILDNLRRTLSAPAAFLTLVAGWAMPGTSPWVWSGFILATIAVPSLLPFLLGLYPRRRGISMRSHVRGAFVDLTLGLAQIGLTITFLAYQAWLMTDAILRTLSRLAITRTHLLEWVTAAQATDAYACRLGGMYKRMSGGLILAAAAGVVVIVVRYESWAAAAPFIILWALAPAVARWVSLPPRWVRVEPVSPADTQALRAIARRTWRFFEAFVSPEDHALPPDNFQEDPKPVVAHRTSPTNMGLYLLSILAARDFGWLGTVEATERVEATLTTMGRLELFRGHFYNWYDTRELLPLHPKYVSSVDSGNLAGHLLALANGCRDLLHTATVNGNLSAGMDDAIRLLRESLGELPERQHTHTVTRKQLAHAVDTLAASLSPMPADASGRAACLMKMTAAAQTIADMAQVLASEQADGSVSELRVWAEAAKACVESHVRDMRVLIPWARLSPKELAAMAILSRPLDEAPELAAIAPLLHSVPTLGAASERFDAVLRALETMREGVLNGAPAEKDMLTRIETLAEVIRQSAADVAALIRRLSAIADHAERMARAMDFTFLFDPMRKLLSIGYRVPEGSLDPSCYDLLASEARLASFIAIAKGDVPSSHWFHLGRALTPVANGSALISWSGSIFEYLMPALVMHSPAGSLLNRTYELIVRRQILYGAERGVPWGVSESAYNVRDLDLTYQYSSFGVPGLGLKRGLSEDTVIAPYAAALAAMIDPAAAARGFERLALAGGRGTYGFYEALDYTGTRLPEGKTVAVVRAYMSHHQGMSLVAIGNAVNDGVMRSRFHAEPIIRATELLLQERTPRDVPVARPRAEEVSAAAQVRDLIAPVLRRFTTPHDATPRTHLLSNGRYAVMVTAAGSGYSRWGDMAITRWREDATRDCWGSFIFLRDAATGYVWSAGYQPCGVNPDEYEASFYEDHAEIIRRDGEWTSTYEIVVSSEDDAEVRRVSLTNLGGRPRDVQITSYAEASLAPQAADVAHPAFSSLFVQTEFVPDPGVLLATRRRRSDEEATAWAAQVVVVDGETVGALEYETDRARFLGRGHHVRSPVSMMDDHPLSNTVGSVLDPVMSLRRTIRVPAGGTVHVMFSTIVGPTREQVVGLADKYSDLRVFDRALSLAWTQAQVQLHHLGIGAEEAHLFQRLANAVLYADASLRPSQDVLTRTELQRVALWAQGISGDLPIVVACIDKAEDLDMVRQLLRAHEYWRMKQLSADVIILNDKPASYEQDLQSSLDAVVRGSRLRLLPDTGGARGSIFLLRADLLAIQDRMLLHAAARIVLLSRRGTLSEQIARLQRLDGTQQPPVALPLSDYEREDVPVPIPDLEFFNGLGGFAADGREYVITLTEGLRTPQPWINVIANPFFGFLVSESGSGFTWSLNSHENQLTPWSNDPVTDPSGEALYVRDDDAGEIWGPTALPIRDELASYVVCHGQGYTRFHQGSHGILTELTQFVPSEDPIKISRLVLENKSGRSRRLSVTAYAEWVLGSSRSSSAPYIVTEADQKTGALFARNLWGGEFGGRIAFSDLAGQQTSWTGDRMEFVGRNGTAERPLAVERGGALSGRTGAGLDPCAALQTSVELLPGARAEIIWFLGQADGKDQARELLARYRDADVDHLLREVARRWEDILGAVQVTTPDRAMDVLLNRWLLYQTLVCRVWARAGFYQLSGAYGFRDQLQDGMALSVAARDITREHLLRAAGRQFTEGDVQHWWHPPSGRGVRTRISDDLLWLPYAVIQFIETTGEMSVLDDVVPFVEGPPLAEGQHESYFEPRVSETRASLFEHCARALDRSLGIGSHGLPLMGTGDWNDGMNRVGQEGRGESVWLGWFLHTVLWEFAKVAASRGEHARAERWRLHVSALKAALEREGWDGEWYRRAYFDDGTPLGSATNPECRIDSIAQTWGVISGAADPGRAMRAMAALDQHLINRTEGLILLLTPPFDKMPADPGYIKGYVPGIRENGGQYTHAAIWTVLAFVALGDGDKAGGLFQMLNPVHRVTSRAKVQRYKVEPYVVAGDIYGEPPHVGRGGWTWYSGSAGWLYRAGIEWMLGFRVRGAALSIDPCIPRRWPGYGIRFRYHSSVYDIAVENPRGVSRGVTSIEVDGKPRMVREDIPLLDDGVEHCVRIVLG